MKKPFWGERFTNAGLRMVCIVATLCIAQHVSADDGTQAPAFGPDITPLGRAVSGPANTLNYPDPSHKPIDWNAPNGAAIAPTTGSALPTAATQYAYPAGQPATSAVAVPPQPLKFPFSSGSAPAAINTTALPSAAALPGAATEQRPMAFPSSTVSPTATPATLPSVGAMAMPTVGAPITTPGTAGAGTLHPSVTAASTPAALPMGGMFAAPVRPVDILNPPVAGSPLPAMPTTSTPAGQASPVPAASGASGAPAGPTPAKINPWRPIQAAFREITGSKSDTSGPAPAAEVIEQKSAPTPALASAPNSPVLITPRIAYVRADGTAPMPGDNTTLTPGVYSPSSMPLNNEGAPPDVVYQGTPGCNCGGGSPDGSGTCRTCGGWQPGSCNTNDPNGSCELQRLACKLSKPYPDCSNGCVDFCHSWIFHDDDCWLFSNHKCCPAGCGPWPYGTCPNDGQGQGSGCGGCNCGCGPCVPPPDVYFTVGALVLTRDNRSTPQNVVLATPPGTPVLTTGDFDFDWRVGPSLLLGYRPTKMDAWELSYYGMFDWNKVMTETGPANLSLPGVIGSLPQFSGANTIQVDYNSQIDNVELNYFWHHDNPNVMWMLGFRYFQLDEKFDILSTSDTSVGAYDTKTTNNMGGAQMGVRLRHDWSWGECDVTAKAGAFGNSVGQEQVAFDASAPEPALHSEGTHTGVWAFVGDLGSNCSIYLCRNWCAMAGYNLLWVDGVALAPDQLDFNETGVFNKNGHVFYQGAHVSLGCRW